jgi:hypothetical protein
MPTARTNAHGDPTAAAQCFAKLLKASVGMIRSCV